MNPVLRQNGLKFLHIESQTEIGAEDQSLKFPPTLDSDSLLSGFQKQASGLQSLSDKIRRPNAPKRIRRPFYHESTWQNIVCESFVGGGKILFFILTQDVGGADQPNMLSILQWQIETTQAEQRFLIRKRQGGFDSFLIDLNTQDFQVWIHAPETRGAFERGARVEAVAKVNEQSVREQAVGPREKRGLVEQDEVVDAAESVRSGLPASGLSLRFFGSALIGIRIFY
jgi:hypothetical protein